MSKLVTLYKSDGSQFEEFLVATDYSLVKNKPTNFTPTEHPHVKADITDFAHTHTKVDITDFAHTHNDKTTFINLTGQLQKVSYRRSVIALCELTNDNPSFNSYSIGTLTFHRVNGLNGAVKFDFAVEKRYNCEGYHISSMILTSSIFLNGITPCIFTYNGVKYGGVEVYFSPAELSFVSFYGTTNFNIFGLDYFDTQNATALISEVNNSLNYDPSLIQIYEEISINKKKVILESDSRLSNSRPASDVYSWAKASTKPTYNFSEIGSKPTTLNGYGITDTYDKNSIESKLVLKADLVGGKVPANQLPSYVDDVLEYDNAGAFPTSGETGKIYVAKDSNKIYRWSGSKYAVISETLALGETSATAYRGDYGKIAYDHSQTSHNYLPSGGVAADSSKLGGKLASAYVLLTTLQADYMTSNNINANYATKTDLSNKLGKTEQAADTVKVDGYQVKYYSASAFANITPTTGVHYIVYEN